METLPLRSGESDCSSGVGRDQSAVRELEFMGAGADFGVIYRGRFRVARPASGMGVANGAHACHALVRACHPPCLRRFAFRSYYTRIHCAPGFHGFRCGRGADTRGLTPSARRVDALELPSRRPWFAESPLRPCMGGLRSPSREWLPDHTVDRPRSRAARRRLDRSSR